MFYSRRNGWPNGTIINYYYSTTINDDEDKSSCFVGKSGGEIYKLIETECSNWENDILLCEIHRTAKLWKQWYYYPHNTVITDRTIYI